MSATATHRARPRLLRDLIRSLAARANGKRASDRMARSNYPSTLDVCATCSMRVAGLDDTAPTAYLHNTRKYAVMVTSGQRIDDPISDDDKCNLCERDMNGEVFDVTARRA